MNTSKSETMGLRILWEVSLPQMEKVKYLGVLFTSERKIEREVDRRIDAASAVIEVCTGPL